MLFLFADKFTNSFTQGRSNATVSDDPNKGRRYLRSVYTAFLKKRG